MRLPDDAQVTLTYGQLRELLSGVQARAFEGIGTADAAELTGEDERKLRRLHDRWSRIQESGGRPEVRVSRTSEGTRAHMLFDRLDCIAYGNAHREGEQAPAPVTDPNDADAIADRLFDERGHRAAS